MANRIYSVPFKMARNAGGAVGPFSLTPGQTSAFEVEFLINGSSLSTDASAIVVAGLGFTGSQMIAVSTSFIGAPLLYNSAAINVLQATVTATGANTYIGAEHTGAFSLTLSSSWLSGDTINGASTAFEVMDFTETPSICSFNVVFSTANVAPSSLGSFTSVASGNDSSFGLTWINPTGAGLSASRLYYVSGNTYPTGSEDTYVIVSSADTAKYFSNLDDVGGIRWCFTGLIYDIDGERSTAAYASAVSINASPNPMTSFTVIASGNDSSFGLTWVNPAAAVGSSLSASRLYYTSSAYPTSADSYVVVSSATVAKYFSNLDDIGGIIWGFMGVVYDTDSQASTSVYASAVSINASPNPVTAFTATAVGNGTINLAWTNPAGTVGAALSAIRLNYTYGRMPSAVNDGTTVIVSSATTTKSYTGLTNEDGTLYGFAAWVYDMDLQTSTVTTVSAVPMWQNGNRAWKSHKEHMRLRNLGYI